MKILIVSDTHGQDEHFDEVLIREAPFDMLIHCGDVEGRELYLEAVLDCPSCIVAGNNDFFSDLPREEVLKIGKHRAFVTHGHAYGVSWERDTLVRAAKLHECDLAIFGHTHYPMVEQMDGVLCINPGSLTYPRQKGRCPSYVVLTLDSVGDLHPEILYLN
jgi:hypothetical protein